MASKKITTLSTVDKPVIQLVDKTTNSVKTCDVIARGSGFALVKQNKLQYCITDSQTQFHVIAMDTKNG